MIDEKFKVLENRSILSDFATDIPAVITKIEESQVLNFSTTIKTSGNPLPKLSCYDDFGHLINTINDQNSITLHMVESNLKHLIFTCSAENKLGYDEKMIVFEILRAPEFYVEDLDLDDIFRDDSIPQTFELQQNVNSKLILDCSFLKNTNPAPKITWYKNAFEIRNEKVIFDQNSGQMFTQNVLNFDQLSAMDTGIYKCLVENDLGLIEKQFDVVVNFPPKISPPYKTEYGLFEHENVEFYCKANGRPTAIFEWYFNQKLMANRTSEVLMLTDVSINDMGKYTCLAKNSVGEDQVDFNLQVYVAPTSASDLSFSKTAELGKVEVVSF